uniref:CUB domain-containing protein n=1 Tax=Schistosoma curassoni TaxID=6186 RepID=A0A183KRY1_9TREM
MNPCLSIPTSSNSYTEVTCNTSLHFPALHHSHYDLNNVTIKYQ